VRPVTASVRPNRWEREESPLIAQQLIDAGENGGLAFVAMTVMVFVIGFSLLYMDRIRRGPDDSEER
jgi:hypothetical protein